MQSAKVLLRKAIGWSVSTEILYSTLWSPLLRLARIAEMNRRWKPLQSRLGTDEAISIICPAKVVLHGPFRGMKYPAARAIGSALFAKLLGSYERELHPIIERCIAEDYTHVVDIGCAEGFYAVGLALRMPKARVWAFDIEPEALRLCRAMGELNGVADRITFGGACGASDLLALPLGRKALVISDCEGFEMKLFTDDVCRRLASHDFLIESHDYKVPATARCLLERFARSHDVEIIRSISDFCRPQIFAYRELENFDKATQISLLAELRPAEMEWLFFHSRKNDGAKSN